MNMESANPSGDMVAERLSDRERRLLKIVAESIVRPSFLRCCKQNDAFFDSFYLNLADRIPDVGLMFARTDMKTQNALIHDGVKALMDYAAGRDSVMPELKRLGILHNRGHLNIQPAMYSGWIDAMLDAVAEHDPIVTSDIQAAWREVLTPGIDLMAFLY